MDVNIYRAALAAAMEAGFQENFNTGEGCHGLADAYMATVSEARCPRTLRTTRRTAAASQCP
ncbi:hypothetical protein ACIP9X_18935 [Arthrobacter sp. NPDC093125]|uniref:hypothetical protein n=1 Tax=Arthrobacter sp. NPDC093125 TaxID=3363944 RepID=UPI00382C64DF